MGIYQSEITRTLNAKTGLINVMSKGSGLVIIN